MGEQGIVICYSFLGEGDRVLKQKIKDYMDDLRVNGRYKLLEPDVNDETRFLLLVEGDHKDLVREYDAICRKLNGILDRYDDDTITESLNLFVGMCLDSFFGVDRMLE